jgi:hypothetical protein
LPATRPHRRSYAVTPHPGTKRRGSAACIIVSNTVFHGITASATASFYILPALHGAIAAHRFPCTAADPRFPRRAAPHYAGLFLPCQGILRRIAGFFPGNVSRGVAKIFPLYTLVFHPFIALMHSFFFWGNFIRLNQVGSGEAEACRFIIRLFRIGRGGFSHL